MYLSQRQFYGAVARLVSQKVLRVFSLLLFFFLLLVSLHQSKHGKHTFPLALLATRSKSGQSCFEVWEIYGLVFSGEKPSGHLVSHSCLSPGFLDPTSLYERVEGWRGHTHFTPRTTMTSSASVKRGGE